MGASLLALAKSIYYLFPLALFPLFFLLALYTASHISKKNILIPLLGVKQIDIFFIVVKS